MSLIETKFRSPVLGANLVQRHALMQRLDALLGVKLGIICAPAGFGKSTILGQWAQNLKSRNIEVGWLSLDGADDDLSRFLDYLLAALNRADETLVRDVPTLLRSSPVLPVDSVLTTLVNDLSRRNRDIVLVLDDCHFLTSPDIVNFLDTFLTYAPQTFHLVLATREQVPLKVANMRVKGQMVRLDDATLRFSLTESEAFLNQVHGLGLESADIVSLHHRTEGWVAGLQIASLSLTERSDRTSFVKAFSGTDRDIANFLVNDVLERLPKATLEFLLKTSVLDRLCVPLAEAVTGQADSRKLLSEIEASNLFLIPLDRDQNWYRYHGLFADLLRSLLQKQFGVTVSGLHQKAAKWLSENGLASDAVQHALLAGDTEFAAELVESCCMPLIQQSHITRVREWLNSLPEELISKRPRLQLARVWIQFHMSLPLPAAKILKSARESIRAAERQGIVSASEREILNAEFYTLTAGIISAADRSATAARLARGWLAQMPDAQFFAKGTLGNVLGFSLFSLGNLDEARLACLVARDSHEAANSILGVVYSELILGLTDQSAGNLSGAHDHFSRAINRAHASLGAGSYAEAMVGVFEAELHYEWDDLAGAETLLQQHRQVIEECGLVVHEMACKLNLAKLAASKGNDDEALIILEAAERQGLKTRYRRLFASALDERVRLLLLRGDVPAARLALKSRGIDEVNITDNTATRLATEPEHMAMARLLTAEGRPELAMRILDRLASRLRLDGRMQRLAKVRALSAVAAFQSGDALSALAAVVDAVSICAPHGAVRSLVDEGSQFQDVVEFCRSRIPSWSANSEVGAFVDRVKKVRQTNSLKIRTPQFQRRMPQFSTREADVVRLLSGGQSNRDVAQALKMAPDTVKWHLKNIFGKLHVSNRTQAVLRLQELGMGTSGSAGRAGG